MHPIKVLKKLDVTVIKTLTVDNDRAMTDYRAFYHIGDLHAKKVNDPYCLNVMLEIVENLREQLLSRSNEILFTNTVK